MLDYSDFPCGNIKICTIRIFRFNQHCSKRFGKLGLVQSSEASEQMSIHQFPLVFPGLVIDRSYETAPFGLYWLY